jgi:hypothetical protein
MIAGKLPAGAKRGKIQGRAGACRSSRAWISCRVEHRHRGVRRQATGLHYGADQRPFCFRARPSGAKGCSHGWSATQPVDSEPPSTLFLPRRGKGGPCPTQAPSLCWISPSLPNQRTGRGPCSGPAVCCASELAWASSAPPGQGGSCVLHHGLRCAPGGCAPPVATFRRPFGAGSQTSGCAAGLSSAALCGCGLRLRRSSAGQRPVLRSGLRPHAAIGIDALRAWGLRRAGDGCGRGGSGSRG